MLESDDLRNGIKAYSNWPTIPQLYVKGEFVGGCDIIREMFQAGELQDLLKEKGVRGEDRRAGVTTASIVAPTVVLGARDRQLANGARFVGQSERC